MKCLGLAIVICLYPLSVIPLVNHCFKKLLWNYNAKFNQNSQEVFLHDSLQEQQQSIKIDLQQQHQ